MNNVPLPLPPNTWVLTYELGAKPKNKVQSNHRMIEKITVIVIKSLVG